MVQKKYAISAITIGLLALLLVGTTGSGGDTLLISNNIKCSGTGVTLYEDQASPNILWLNLTGFSESVFNWCVP